MKKILYIIPGWEETCRRKPYQLLAKSASKKGYEVVFKNINWKGKLSDQFFPVEKEAVIFGFSLGALMTRLIAQNYPCKHIILASMTPLYYFKDKKMEKLLADAVGSAFVKDIKKHLKTRHKAKKQTTMYGDKEGDKADIIVANTDHEITSNYINEIMKII